MTSQLCQKCQKGIDKQSQKEQKRYVHPKISLGFLYHLGLDLEFSFQSIALMGDFIISRASKKLQMKLLKILDNENCQILDQHYDENLVQIRFDGNPLTRTEAQSLANSCYSKVKNGMELVISMFGIGKTGVLISNNGVEKTVIMFSVDDRVNPNYYKEENAVLYIENNTTNQIQNINGSLLKKIIIQGLKIYHPDPQKIIDCGANQMKVLIFHPKIFVSSNKLMFYEIRQSNFGHDIDTHFNPQKIQFLNKIGYEMSIHSQFRLSCYLSCLYLEPKFNVIIGDTQQQICKTSYLKQLEVWKQNGGLVKLPDPKIYGTTKTQLYETTENYFSKNNGILLYWKGRLINRFGVEFGRMLQQKFYKKKYRTPPQNIWKVVGIIQLNDKLFTPNLLRNKFVNTFEYRKLVKDIQMYLKNTQRKSNVIVIQNQPDELSKQNDNDSSYNYQMPQPKKKVKKSKERQQNVQ